MLVAIMPYCNRWSCTMVSLYLCHTHAPCYSHCMEWDAIRQGHWYGPNHHCTRQRSRSLRGREDLRIGTNSSAMPNIAKSLRPLLREAHQAVPTLEDRWHEEMKGEIQTILKHIWDIHRFIKMAFLFCFPFWSTFGCLLPCCNGGRLGKLSGQWKPGRKYGCSRFQFFKSGQSWIWEST